MTQADEMMVLVASGDILLRDPLVDYLRDCGYRVAVAATTAEALELLESGYQPDYVVADVHTKGKVDGFAIARLVRSVSPSTEVVMTANIEKTAAVAGDICEDGPHEEKAYDPQVLVRRLRRARPSGFA